jgi:hypothetical protein
MLAIDLPTEDRSMGDDLEKAYPSVVAVIDGRAIDGTLTHWTLFLSVAAIAIPEIRKIVAEILQSRRHRSFTFKGIKFQGYSDDEIKNVLSELSKMTDKS